MNPCIKIFSLFPEIVDSVLNSSILRRAQAKGLIDLEAINIRDFAKDKHRIVDDTPYGGKQGMLLKADVLDSAMAEQLALVEGDRSRLKIVFTSPRGLRFEQPVAEKFCDWLGEESTAAPKILCIVCGRYEGVDERFIDQWVDVELSLGDFILSGGEIAALAFADAVVRLIPGVLGHQSSAREDSFSNGLLEYPQYTRPVSLNEQGVPEELKGGNHKLIHQWQTRQSLLLTSAFRPDLIKKHTGENLEPWAQDLLSLLKTKVK